MPRPKTPTQLRVLAGNPAKRPLPENEPTYPTAQTRPPEWLQGEAITIWEKLAASLEINNMLNHANYDFLAAYCDLMGRYIEQRRDGLDPDLKIVQQLRLMAREFGFTPSSQAGVGMGTSPKGEDDKKQRFFK